MAVHGAYRCRSGPCRSNGAAVLSGTDEAASCLQCEELVLDRVDQEGPATCRVPGGMRGQSFGTNSPFRLRGRWDIPGVRSFRAHVRRRRRRSARSAERTPMDASAPAPPLDGRRRIDVGVQAALVPTATQRKDAGQNARTVANLWTRPAPQAWRAGRPYWFGFLSSAPPPTNQAWGGTPLDTGRSFFFFSDSCMRPLQLQFV